MKRANSRGRWTLAAVRCWQLLGILAVSVFLADRPLWGQAPPAEFYQDFRGSQRPLLPASPFGPDAETSIKPEPGGLRITLPAARKDLGPVGIVLTDPVQGNFEITAGYEIIQADSPKKGYGVGFEVYLMTATATQEALAFYRLAHAKEGEVHMCSRNTYESGKRRFKVSFLPTSCKSGRLRVTRTGAEVVCSAAEGGAGEFQEVCRHELGTEELKMIRLAAFTGGAPYAVDMRIVDLKIRSEIPVQAQGVEVASPVAAPLRSRWKLWLAAAILGLIATCSVVAWLYARRSRCIPVTPGAAASVSCRCTGCGKELRARPELAGKKVKCPQCGQTVLVPAAAV